MAQFLQRGCAHRRAVTEQSPRHTKLVMIFGQRALKCFFLHYSCSSLRKNPMDTIECRLFHPWQLSPKAILGQCQIFDRCPDTMNASTSSIHKSLSPHIEQASANDSVRVLKLMLKLIVRAEREVMLPDCWERKWLCKTCWTADPVGGDLQRQAFIGCNSSSFFYWIISDCYYGSIHMFFW